jgi:hypothetical protein
MTERPETEAAHPNTLIKATRTNVTISVPLNLSEEFPTATEYAVKHWVRITQSEEVDCVLFQTLPVLSRARLSLLSSCVTTPLLVGTHLLSRLPFL